MGTGEWRMENCSGRGLACRSRLPARSLLLPSAEVPTGDPQPMGDLFLRKRSGKAESDLPLPSVSTRLRFLFQLNLRGLLRQQQPPLLLNRCRQLQPRRRFLFLSGERKRKSAEKRKKARGFGYGESGDGVRTCGAEKRRLISPTTAVSLRPQCRRVGLALSSAVFGFQPCGHFSKDACPHQVLRNALR